MPKKINRIPSEVESSKMLKKKGRPRKVQLNGRGKPPVASKHDDVIITKYIKQALLARRVQSLLDVYEQR